MIKVLIIATPRSGSTTLLDSISKAYGITGYYEPFGSKKKKKKYDFNSGDHVVKTIVDQINLDTFDIERYTHLICLTRKNILEAAQSYDYAMREHDTSDGVSWHRGYTLKESDNKTKYYKRFKDEFDIVSNLSIFPVFYEDLFFGTKEEALSILQKLGFPRTKSILIYEEMMKTSKYRKFKAEKVL